jgi:triphosphatase
MSQEIELKLTICQESIEPFFSLPLLANQPQESFFLENTYFDTQDKQLTQSAAALRIRKSPEGFVQTLKSRGQNIGGLHRRDEWEVEIQNSQLNFSLFPPKALPEGLTESEFSPLFKTDFERTRWLIEYQQSEIELVLDVGKVSTQNGQDHISELELELKRGNLDDLFNLAQQISEQVAIMPSDISKAERGYRLCQKNNDVYVDLPDIVPQQSMESAFCALFGYEMERLQRHWQVFWSTQEWRHLQSFLNTLGNMEAEIEWFQGMLPTGQIQFVHEQLDWISSAVRPILSWWPACFALSQDAEQEPQSVAISLQQSKAKKALKALKSLQINPELGHRTLSLTAWLHGRAWCDGQSDTHRTIGEMPVSDGIDYSFDKALNDLQTDCFAGSASHALSQSPAVHRLLMLCQYFDRLYGKQIGSLRVPLQALDDNLSRLSAMEVVARLKDWLNDLPFEQQASVHSWTRSQTILLRDIKQLASKLIRGRNSMSGGSV